METSRKKIGLISSNQGYYQTQHQRVPYSSSRQTIGLHPHNVVELAEQKIHLHFMVILRKTMEGVDRKTNRMAPGYLHIHPNVDQQNWVKEFSQYDAGWLHFFKSENRGELKRANWDDLNIPARTATLALCGVPMLQKNNDGHIVATQSLVKKLNLGLLFNDMQELGELIRDRQLMNQLRTSVWNQRHWFTFDDHVGTLVEFFETVIKNCKVKNNLRSIAPKALTDHTYVASKASGATLL
jgi:hypothetical protein